MEEKKPNPLVWHERKDEIVKGQMPYTGRTFAVIREGDRCFVGLSECSDRDFFSRKIGYITATNRAKHARDTYHGIKQPRGDEHKQHRREYLSFSFPVAKPDEALCPIPPWMYEKQEQA